MTSIYREGSKLIEYPLIVMFITSKVVTKIKEPGTEKYKACLKLLRTMYSLARQPICTFGMQ